MLGFMTTTFTPTSSSIQTIPPSTCLSLSLTTLLLSHPPPPPTTTIRLHLETQGVRGTEGKGVIAVFRPITTENINLNGVVIGGDHVDEVRVRFSLSVHPPLPTTSTTSTISASVTGYYQPLPSPTPSSGLSNVDIEDVEGGGFKVGEILTNGEGEAFRYMEDGGLMKLGMMGMEEGYDDESEEERRVLEMEEGEGDRSDSSSSEEEDSESDDDEEEEDEEEDEDEDEEDEDEEEDDGVEVAEHGVGPQPQPRTLSHGNVIRKGVKKRRISLTGPDDS
eukprot:CAMPEP_0118651086 /NCGR_PEP_ID=MMETSP0785-20121206/10601_1 /TAXON_ID=91992 /ORGANISM="Bolidomonas pacifica, Strain CCMP 1866" /LENGTH=277 /DNA_ID=CAMNT_0006543521 /DNA_START=214 /DNA_END=1043 /DNA_ORIENTATION=-